MLKKIISMAVAWSLIFSVAASVTVKAEEEFYKVSHPNIEQRDFVAFNNEKADNQVHGKPKILVYMRPGCYYSRTFLSNIEPLDFSGVDVLVVHQEAKTLDDLREKFADYKNKDVRFACNDESNYDVSGSLYGSGMVDYLYMAGEFESVTYPVAIYIDKDNNVCEIDINSTDPGHLIDNCRDYFGVDVSLPPVYRLLNPATGEHLFTLSENERNDLKKAGWIEEASPGCSESDDGIPVYRLFNPETKEHLYTADSNEKKALAKNGWSVDNDGKPVFYGAEDGAKFTYRLFNPNADSIISSHHYTSDSNEIRTLLSQGWLYDNHNSPVWRLR